jgi:hypothetical protein
MAEDSQDIKTRGGRSEIYCVDKKEKRTNAHIPFY